jgi:hypothetical protein
VKNFKTIAGLVGVLALSASPAFAVNGNAPDNSGTSHAPSSTPAGPPSKSATPGPKASLPSKAKAYGKYCQTESKKHVAGTPGTPFSKCVTAMAKVANGKANPTTACKTESKKHVAGTPGTPFSKCVSGAAKLLGDQSDSTES